MTKKGSERETKQKFREKRYYTSPGILLVVQDGEEGSLGETDRKHLEQSQSGTGIAGVCDSVQREICKNASCLSCFPLTSLELFIKMI